MSGREEQIANAVGWIVTVGFIAGFVWFITAITLDLREKKVLCFERGGVWISTRVQTADGRDGYVTCVRPPLVRISTDRRAS